jgi:hypothetical protein
MDNEKNERVTLNGKEMDSAQFEQEKKSLIEKKIQIIETSKNNYITRMLD